MMPALNVMCESIKTPSFDHFNLINNSKAG